MMELRQGFKAFLGPAGRTLWEGVGMELAERLWLGQRMGNLKLEGLGVRK
jgi:hypothetical protein